MVTLVLCPSDAAAGHAGGMIPIIRATSSPGTCWSIAHAEVFAMKTPTDILRAEHGLILRALESLEVAASRLTANKVLPTRWWDDMLAWLGTFADRNHHARRSMCSFRP